MKTTIRRATDRQTVKFAKLKSKTKPTQSPKPLSTSRIVLSIEEISLVAKGENFAISPTTVPIEDIIANVEKGIRNLPIIILGYRAHRKTETSTEFQ